MTVAGYGFVFDNGRVVAFGYVIGAVNGAAHRVVAASDLIAGDFGVHGRARDCASVTVFVAEDNEWTCHVLVFPFCLSARLPDLD